MPLHVPKEHNVTSLMMGILWIAEEKYLFWKYASLSEKPCIKEKASLQDPIVSNNVVKNNSAWPYLIL